MRTLLAVGVVTIHLPAAWADAQIDVLVQLRVSDTETVAAEDAVVWLPGFYRDGAGRHTKRIVQRFKRFDPRVTVISTGKVVEFPNFDRIDHNVFSLSDAKTFDLGLYRSGASRSLLFDRPGVVGIHCNIHPEMVAYLVVVDSNVHAKTDASGRARLSGVAAGRYSLAVWHDMAAPWQGGVDTRAGRGEPMTIELDVRGWAQPAHLDKYGQPYDPAGHSSLY